MVDILAKSQDYAGGTLLGYVPPVTGLSVCAFIGDAESNWLTNYGSGGAIVATGAPSVQANGFRRFLETAYLTLPVAMTDAMTVCAVYRNVTPITLYGQICCSERDYIDGGRRGFSLFRYNVNQGVQAGTFGTNAGANLTVAVGLTDVDGPAFVAATRAPLSPGAQISLRRLTATAQTPAAATNTNATFGATGDEASYPLLVGREYRTGANTGGPIDVGFLAVAPRVLSSDEITALYNSVKKRFTALGTTI